MKKVNGKDLIRAGYDEGKILGLALEAVEQFPHLKKDELLVLLREVRLKSSEYLGDDMLRPLAQAIIEEENRVEDIITLRDTASPYTTYGVENIEAAAHEQMDWAMKLPVTAAGALMPDAHQGYGLPIGGVLATRNTVIPYGVGVDIGCRMALSVFDIPEDYFNQNWPRFKRELIAQTKFGSGASFRGSELAAHDVLEREEFHMNALLRSLHDKAVAQLGTSGGGNHFVEWGIIEFTDHDAQLNIPSGRYLALLSHSGSRGLGATIANHYTRVAKSVCKLPREAANLAYLDLQSEAGAEYWQAMTLAGDFASACHEVIHKKMRAAIGGTLLARVENHHNFAWKETLNGEEVIVHRKGATPAGAGVMGIIPGSMATPGFLVRGRGDLAAINSAAHGAGRKMSRTQALKTITRADMSALLKANNVMLVGAGADEAPDAYKDIHKVMAAQRDLVDVVATFTPRMVRMADDGSRED